MHICQNNIKNYMFSARNLIKMEYYCYEPMTSS